jgi:transcriptional regulator with XRE-family HTH domain
MPQLPPAAERRRLRLAVRITIVEAAGVAGVSTRTYARWERGGEPNLRNYRKYADLLERWEAQLPQGGHDQETGGKGRTDTR